MFECSSHVLTMHHFDPLGTAGVITNNSAAVISNNLYDVFGVLRYEQGSAQTPWRWMITRLSDESMVVSPLQVCWGVPSVAASVNRLLSCSPNPEGGWRIRIPGRWLVLPCVLCILGFAPGFLVYFSDCGWPKPWDWQWHQCVTLYWDTFWQTCQGQ